MSASLSMTVRRRAALALGVAALACGGASDVVGDDPIEVTNPVLRVQTVPAADTVQAVPTDRLVVTVLGDGGRAAPRGTVVNFAVAAPLDGARALERGVFICPDTAGDCGTINVAEYHGVYANGRGLLSDSTDAGGATRIRLRFGSVAGPAWIVMTVPAYGLRDSVRLDVRPGAPTRLTLSIRDTLLTAGGQSLATAGLLDRFGNVRDDRPAITSSAPDVVSIDTASRVATALRSGDAILRATAGAFSDTAPVAVRPSGRIAAYAVNSPGTGFTGLAMMNLDGSARHDVIASTGYAVLKPQLSPDRSHVLYIDGATPSGGGSIFGVDSAGTTRTEPLPPGAGSVRYSHDTRYAWFVYGSALARARTDGSDRQNAPEVLYRSSVPYVSISTFDMAPDERQFVFTEYYGELFVASLETGTERSLGVYGFNARWSPDGATIYYNSSDFWGAIYAIPAAGGTRRLVTRPGKRFAPHFDLSPDGDWLLLRSEQAAALQLVRVTNGRALAVPSSGELYQPSWR